MPDAPLSTIEAPIPEIEALIPEARRHRKNRWLLTIGFTVAVAVIVAAALAGAGAFSNGLSNSSNVSTSDSMSPVRFFKSALRNVTLPPGYKPIDIISHNQSVYVLGSKVGGCEVAMVDGATLSSKIDGTTVCGEWSTWGDGSLLSVTSEPGGAAANDSQLHLTRFDPRNGTTFTGPPVMTLNGSENAHVGFAYGDGAVWMAGREAGQSNVLLRISAKTGQLLQRWQVPISFDTGVLTANATGAWVTSTPGSGTGAIYRA